MKPPRRNRQRKRLSQPPQAGENPQQSPLEYLIATMNDRTASKERRDRCAVVAARYMHARPGDAGKKARKAEAAMGAGAGTHWDDDLEPDGDRRQ
jgi:hypothetical protein